MPSTAISDSRSPNALPSARYASSRNIATTPSRFTAERWLTQHRYSNEVTEDEAGADGIAGRGRLIFPIRCAGSLVWIRPSRRFVHRNARSIVLEASTFAPIGGSRRRLSHWLDRGRREGPMSDTPDLYWGAPKDERGREGLSRQG